MKTLRLGLMLALLFGVAACGYQLRGSLDIPDEVKNLYMGGASPFLQTEMTGILQSAKGRVVPLSSEAGVVLRIVKEDMRTRVLSIGTTGKSTESELNYYLRYQFFNNKDEPLADEQVLEIAREFFNDQTAILAKTGEEQLIRTEIYKQAARILLARAKAVLDTQKK